MAMASKTRDMLDGLVKEGSFKWLLGKRDTFDEEFEEIGRSPSARKHWIPELSPIANVVVHKCSKIIGISPSEFQESFNREASESIKDPSKYARNLLECCCFRTLALSTQVTDHLADKKFRRLLYDMMVAWEVPSPSCEPLHNVDEDASVGVEAFSRIAPAFPILANVVTSENLFEVLTSSNAGGLQFAVFNKYLTGLERAIKKMKNHSESSLLSTIQSSEGEKIIEVDGTITTQPVLEHIGMSTWPGRLILTDHALYFEALRVVSYDKARRYSLSEDLKQVVKPELTGPWGTRVFDKAVSFKSISLSEPVVLEFPELKGHSRRDYWLAIIREILYAHRFINKFHISGLKRDETLSRAVLGILRLHAIEEIMSASSVRCESVLMFNLCDELPGGDLILKTLANMSHLKELERKNNSETDCKILPDSNIDTVCDLDIVVGTSPSSSRDVGFVIGDVAVGEMSLLEIAIKESRDNYKKRVLAQETVDDVKVDGIDTNLAVMTDLLQPLIEAGKFLLSLAYWDDPLKSLVFCLLSTFIICWELLGYIFALILTFVAVCMVIMRGCKMRMVKLKVIAPPPMNTVEQLLAVQNAVSQLEEFIQGGNVVLLKLRALLLSVFPQASGKVALTLLLMALIMTMLPSKYVFALIFLEGFTRYSPPRKASTERWMRRLKEWWFSIPAAPVVLESGKEDKKKN